VVHGDGAAMPFDDGRFSAVVCFTVLHHVPSPALQDRLFAEAFRVLRPGGVFAGTDSLPNLRFRLLHLFDTMVTVDPATLPARLAAAGFTGVEVAATTRRVRFRARKPLLAA
jgi:ubiquinone/menaquinone biosynthesis C-methylase UbiE